MVSTSGSQLLSSDAVSIVRDELLPLATVVTPNIPEAKLLLQREREPDPKTRDDLIRLAIDLHKLGPQYVLIKGGHLRPSNTSTEEPRLILDILYGGESVALLGKDYIDTKNTHGTGCSLACKSLS